MDTLLTHNPALQVLGVAYLILVLKMVAVGSYTSIIRLRRNVFATPEDYKMQGLAPAITVDEDIERVRRAHRNDLENILPFFGVALLYAFTQPSLFMARVFFWGFCIARVLHSIFYIRQMQPHRTIAYGAGLILMLLMLLVTLVKLL